MHDERTLTDAEVNKAMDDIKQTLAELGAILRS
jgi:phenylalanyl-tRNA synthetase beta subunit